MFDWPEQIQTSPSSTSWNVTVFLPATTIASGLPSASIGGSLQRHLPSAAAIAETELPASFTVTVSPGAAVPQTTIGICC